MPFFCYNKKDYCDHSENCDNCDVWVLGKGGKEVPTNADRIRAMSDKELVDFLGEYRFCDICDEGCEACTYHGDCDKRLMEWLKQPAEVKADA